jgi:LEA14-like dessication related protein
MALNVPTATNAVVKLLYLLRVYNAMPNKQTIPISKCPYLYCMQKSNIRCMISKDAINHVTRFSPQENDEVACSVKMPMRGCDISIREGRYPYSHLNFTIQ